MDLQCGGIIECGKFAPGLSFENPERRQSSVIGGIFWHSDILPPHFSMPGPGIVCVAIW